jgi:hypothetical protein
MISPRDFVLWRYLNYTKDKIQIYSTSVKSNVIPEVKGTVRAESIYGGFIIERIDDNKCKLTLFSVVKGF